MTSESVTMQTTTGMQHKSPTIVVMASRVHMGHSLSPPDSLLPSISAYISDVIRLVKSGAIARGALAVDITGRCVARENEPSSFDLVGAVREIVSNLCRDEEDGGRKGVDMIDIIPVTPWGNFVPALNAILSWSAGLDPFSRLLLASLESSSGLNSANISLLSDNLNDNTLVCGAVLPGHDYQGRDEKRFMEVELSGRTCPWNTVAMWNVQKLSMTGFLAVSEGLHAGSANSAKSAGVEEVAAIATLQHILTPQCAKAKLIPVPGIRWKQDWQDEGRREWHERKMKSKISRPARHLELLGLSEGKVEHY